MFVCFIHRQVLYYQLLVPNFVYLLRVLRGRFFVGFTITSNKQSLYSPTCDYIYYFIQPAGWQIAIENTVFYASVGGAPRHTVVVVCVCVYVFHAHFSATAKN